MDTTPQLGLFSNRWALNTWEGLSDWLDQNGLCFDCEKSYQPEPGAALTAQDAKPRIVHGVACQRKRVERLKSDKVKALKAAAARAGKQATPESADQVWEQYKKRKSIVLELDLNRMPADAMGFYHPFHLKPQREWGIYLYVDKLVGYCRCLQDQLGPHYALFDDATILTYVLFEIFHHEFFHHMIESCATTLEIASAAMGEPRPIYVAYRRGIYQDPKRAHEDKPLEEALANAYAFNSLSFISRVNFGVKTVGVAFYQELLKRYWPSEPPGYRAAEKYILDGYVTGATSLLAQMLPARAAESPIFFIAERVMPQGHTAFNEKAEVPTYLVGTPKLLAEFDSFIPAPCETYTTLFDPRDTGKLDEKLRTLKAAEKKNVLRRTGGARG